ncbi:hypothetical protein IAQ61_009581 [Plenodomus lingam]|uniref:Predicted protein n=1 Tax=Leptosphaeria maculans (strain JN3 / isolate v23.1.3 / race Av1-4-5-6-7-8) TaxID=985895 RepID=E4ZSZ6_LEPMJ|nr:predicted protein [Plenodomus lingam JN3]KAH9863304.1 hypothetical protein IAQ61_009581 [Plenodomus lingam]CBX94584.1 predicted protein [Plenodomus lingam JN3]
MADEHDFDIDIYGDDQDPSAQQDEPQTDSNAEPTNGTAENAKGDDGDTQMKQEPPSDAANSNKQDGTSTQQIASTGGSAGQDVHRQAPQKQGMKRKQGEDDDRPTDPGATAALMVNDVNWWISEEDIRGWANQSGCEDELVEVTFNEHKVNGKSKGQVYVQLQTPQAATALKHQIDNLFKDQAHTKKPTAIFNPPHVNPFKTLPKDVPAREKGRNDRALSSNYSNQGVGNYNRGGYNNNRGGFNSNRGNNMGYQNNRNFPSPVGGPMGNNMAGGYGAQTPMNGFNNPMAGGMNGFGGFNNRGGMMGNNMRGGMNNRGRGGGMGMNTMGANPMGMGMPMANNMMGMGGNMMGMGGNMGMMGGMGGGFAGSPQGFNTGFFQGNQGGAGNDGSWQNPHGAKRPRPE